MSKQRQCRGKAKSFFNRMGIGFGTVFLGLMTAASGTPRMPVKTTAAEGIGGITVESISASPSSESVKTDVRFEENGTAELYIRIKSGDDVISESSQSVSFVENEIKTFTLNRPLEYASGKIEVIYSLTDNAGAVLDEEKIPMKNSVVQLSEDSIECVVNEMTIEEKAQLVTGYNVSGSTLQPSGVAGGTYAIERLGIPQIVMADGSVGVRIDTNAGITNTYGISYPSEALLACSWNTETVRTVGAALGRDCKDFGIDFILGPGLNIQRSILGGRNFEYFSEDSYLTGVMGTAYVEGIQSEGTGAITHLDISEKAAVESIVLLENKDMLPLDCEKISLFGNAQRHPVIGGLGAGDVNTCPYSSFRDALKSRFSLGKTADEIYKNCPRKPIGFDEDENPENDVWEVNLSEDAAAKAAEESDAAIVFISRLTREGKDHTPRKGDYRLNERERNMLITVSNAFHMRGKKVCVVLDVGNPIEVESWKRYADALVFLGYAGQRSAEALASILRGEKTPSARLAFSIPVACEDSPAHESFLTDNLQIPYNERYFCRISVL